MKILKRISVLLLAVIMLFCAACSCDGEEEVVQNQFTKYEATGLHEFNYTETDDYLIKDGKTDYKLVVQSAKDSSGNVNRASQELRYFFEKATGIMLETVTDNEQLVYSEDVKYISLGETNLKAQAGIETDTAKLKKDGVRIVTKGKSIFIFGGSPSGTLYAVYDFLELEFDYDYYFTNNYELKTGVSNQKLRNYDVTDIPDISTRAISTGWMRDDVETYNGMLKGYYRYRMPHSDNGFLLMPGGRSTHNALDILPIDKFKASHPKWYSSDLLQPCFTAHGDEAELEAMIQQVADTFIEEIISLPNKDADGNLINTGREAITFTIEDGPYHCYCDACKASAEKYGNHESAAVIKFMNRIAEKCETWMATADEIYKRDLYYVFFGYNYYSTAPVYLDEADGTYKVLAPELQPHDKVGVFLAIKNIDYYTSVYTENEQNQNYSQTIETIKQWSDILDFIMLWTYDANYHNKLMPDDRVGYFDSDYYKAMSGLDIDYYFQEGLGQYGGCTHFSGLKGYLTAKMQWNANLNSNDLTLKWFKGMFKESWETMYAYYEDLRMFNLETHTNNIIGGNNQVKAEYWPYQTIKKWSDMCEQATLEIQDYKYTDPDLYKVLLNNINCERVFQDYLFLELYQEYFSATQLGEIKARMKQTVLDNEGIGVSSKGDLAVYVEKF